MNNLNPIEMLKRYIDNEIANIEISTEGIVTEVFKNDKKVRVKPLKSKLKDDNGYVMRIAMALSGNDEQVGGMPSVGSKVTILFSTTNKDEKWQNCIALCGIFDKKDNKSPDLKDVEDEAKKDKQYYAINPQKDESKIEIYKNNIRTVAKKDVKEIIKNGKKVIEISGGSDDKRIMIGEDGLSDDYFLVTKAHLDLFDNLLSELNIYISSFRTMQLIGDMGIPLPFAVRNAGTYESFAVPFQTALNGTLKENGKNKTDTIKAK